MIRSRKASHSGGSCPRRCGRDGRGLGDVVLDLGRPQTAGAQLDRATRGAEQPGVCVPLLDGCRHLRVAAREPDDVRDHRCRSQGFCEHLSLVDVEIFDLASSSRAHQRVGPGAQVGATLGHVNQTLVYFPARAGPEEPFAPERDVASLLLPASSHVECQAVVAQVEEGISCGFGRVGARLLGIGQGQGPLRCNLAGMPSDRREPRSGAAMRRREPSLLGERAMPRRGPGATGRRRSGRGRRRRDGSPAWLRGWRRRAARAARSGRSRSPGSAGADPGPFPDDGLGMLEWLILEMRRELLEVAPAYRCQVACRSRACVSPRPSCRFLAFGRLRVPGTRSRRSTLCVPLAPSEASIRAQSASAAARYSGLASIGSARSQTG